MNAGGGTELKRFIKFCRLSWTRKRRLAAIFIELVRFRWLIATRPFSALERRLGVARRESEASTEADFKPAYELQRDIRAICAALPWENSCLIQAFAAKALLDRARLPATVYLGLARNEKGKLIAHAWVRCGNVFVTGGNGKGYAVSGYYS